MLCYLWILLALAMSFLTFFMFNFAWFFNWYTTMAKPRYFRGGERFIIVETHPKLEVCLESKIQSLPTNKTVAFDQKTFLAVEFRKSKIFAFWFGLKAYFVISVFIPGIFCDQYKPFYTLYQPWPVELGGSALTYLSCRLLDFWKKLFMLIVQNCFRRHNYNDYFFCWFHIFYMV